MHRRHRRPSPRPVPLGGAALLALALACAPPPPDPSDPVRVPVRAEVVSPRPFRPTLVLFGRVEPAATIPVLAPEEGRVSYPPRFAGGLRTGEEVRAGELLVRIHNPDLDHDLAEAELFERSAEAELERARRGVDAGFLPEVELKRREVEAEIAAERLASTRARVERLEVGAPARGLLDVEEPVAPGAHVDARAPLAAVAAAGPPRIEALAAGGDLPSLRPGLEAECVLPGGERIVARGRLAEVARQVAPNGTVRLVVQVAERGGLPAAGEGVEVRVLLDERRQALVVPEESLVRASGVAALFVLESSGEVFRARRRVVETGRSGDGRVEILDGLRAGERIAVRGVEMLSDGVLAVAAQEEESAPP